MEWYRNVINVPVQLVFKLCHHGLMMCAQSYLKHNLNIFSVKQSNSRLRRLYVSFSDFLARKLDC